MSRVAWCAAGESVYGEKRISVEGPAEGEKVEYRVWNPFRSKLAASVLAGVDNIHVRPGAKVRPGRYILQRKGFFPLAFKGVMPVANWGT